MKRRLVVTAGATWLAVLLMVSAAGAYPISPVPLFDLVNSSELVVMAEVVQIREEERLTEPTPEYSNALLAHLDQDAVARLRVVETWKGEPMAAVDVLFPRFLICPAPPRYAEGKVVIAFLTKGERGWETTGLSYGTLYPRQADIDDFRSLVKEAVVLQRLSPVSVADMMSWHVTAASLPGPRWHGLYALVPESDDLHFYYDRRAGGLRLAGVPTTSQLRQIASGFIRFPSTDRTLPMVLALLRGFGDREVSLAAASAIEGLLSGEKPPWWIKRALYLTLERFGGVDLEERLASLGDALSDVTSEQVRSIWEKSKIDLKIPPVPAAKVIEEEVWAVGSNTPS